MCCAGASHSNNLKDATYSLLRSALEMMLLLNKEEGATYAFMLSRVYLQLDINHQVKERKKLEFEKVFNFKVLKT